MKNLGIRLAIALFKLLALLPLSILQSVGAILGLFMWSLNGASRQITEENLRLCFPELTALQQQQLARERLRQLGILGLELAYVWQRSVLDVLATISVVRGKALINDAIAKGNGVILLIPHIGNWEVLGNYIGHHFSTTAMFQPSDNQALDAMIRRSRERCGSTLVPTNTSGVKKLLRALKGGECVAILPDQVPPKGSGIFAPFFKLPALTMTLVYNLVQRTGASVVVGYARRMDDGSFEMVFEAVADNISSADELSSVCALNAAVEQCVNKIPEQYQWEYKRFRKQPQGAKKYYQKK